MEAFDLDTVDVGAAHAAAAIDEEDEFAVNFAQVRAEGLEVRAEVEHDHGVVEDVLVEASADDVDLENKHSPGRWGSNASADQHQSETQPVDVTDAGSSRRHVASRWSVSIETHPYGPLCSNLLV